jgi:hypothetical protein
MASSSALPGKLRRASSQAIAKATGKQASIETAPTRSDSRTISHSSGPSTLTSPLVCIALYIESGLACHPCLRASSRRMCFVRA